MAPGTTVVTVCVQECRNVHSPRSEAPQCFVRVEHGARVLGEGVRVTCDGGEGVMEGGVEVKLECDSSQRQTIDELIQNPVIVSLLEVLPKDKKSKEEKTVLLGHTAIDLLPLLLGERSIQDARTLQAGDIGEREPAVVEVMVSASRGILTAEQQAGSNIMYLRVRSLHSLPDSWSHTHSPPSHFTLSTPHPLPGPPLSLAGAQIKKVESEESHTHWKWPAVRGDDVGSEGVMGERWAVEDENGELRAPDDVAFRRSAECSKPRVDWSTELRTWLPPSPSPSPSSPPSLLTILTQSPLWPVEVVRCTASQSGKGKGKEEEVTNSHHGVAYMDLSPLLYPGASHIAGAYSLHPFSEADIVTKTKRDYTSLLSSPSAAVLTRKTPGGGGGGGKSGKRSDSALRLRSGSMVSRDQPEDQPEGDRPSAIAEEEEKKESKDGVVYEEARSYLWAELQLQRPLVPKRPSSVLAERVAEYVPTRPAMRKREGGAERAVMSFHSVTAAISGSLLGEYRDLFAGQGAEGGDSNMDDRRRQLLFHLNSTGKYHTFKEQLKHAVVGVVRERYGNRTGFSDSAHRHAFLSQLYTYLTDQMHVSLKQVISLEDPPEATPTPVDFDLLKHFAQEAEDFQDYSLAEKYYKERVSCAEHVAQYWYDYGVFCLLIGRLDKAEQCLKEVISLDQKMIPALLLYGMLNCIGERYEQGSEFMELATTFDPTNITAWTMRGLFYEQQGNRLLENMCYEEAARLSCTLREKTYLIPSKTRGRTLAPTGVGGKTPSRPNVGGPGGISTATLGGGGPPPEEEGASGLDVAAKEGGTSTIMASPAEASGQTPSLTDHQIRSHIRSQTIRNNLTESSVLHAQGEAGDDPIVSKVEVPPEAPPPTVLALQRNEGEGSGGMPEDPKRSVFLQTASFLLDVHALKFAEMSLSHIRASPSPPPPLYHILEAILYLHRNEPHRALDCLTAALQLDVQSSYTWSLLGHTHFLLGDFPSAREAYERALLLLTPPPNLHSVLLHLALIHLQDGKHSEAKDVYLRACRNSPSGASWRGVGVACYQLGQLGEAEAALCEANILDNQDPITWAYLALVCLKTSRPVEAEQALKFAVKTGLGTHCEVVKEIQQEVTSHSQDPAHQHIPHLLTQLS